MRLNRSFHRQFDPSVAGPKTITPPTYGRHIGFALLLTWIIPTHGHPGDVSATANANPEVRVSGIAQPSQVSTITTTQQGRIADIPAIEGTILKEGEVLFTLENSVQRARTEMARAEAESTLSIDRAKARWEHADANLKWFTRLLGDDFASSKELTDARSEMEIARIEFEIARFNSLQANRAYERERATLAQYTILAPFNGYVSDYFKEIGETVDPPEPVVRLFRLDPLEVAIDGPLSFASTVCLGDSITVHPVDEGWTPRIGKVTYLSRVADAASQTLRVKVQVPNVDQSWIAGLKVVLVFPGSADKHANKSPVKVGLPNPHEIIGDAQTGARRGG